MLHGLEGELGVEYHKDGKADWGWFALISMLSSCFEENFKFFDHWHCVSPFFTPFVDTSLSDVIEHSYGHYGGRVNG